MGHVPEAELPEGSDVADQGAASGDHEHNPVAGCTDADGSREPEETSDGRAVAREDATIEFGEGDVLTGTPAPGTEVAEPSEDDITTSQQVTDEGWLQRAATKLPQYRRLVWYRESRRRTLEVRSFWRDRDPSENAAGRLPDDERIEVPAIWVTELYTPSTVRGLLDGIHRLGWEFGRHRSNESVVKWMTDVRRGRRAGWTRLGLVAPRGSKIFMRDREADLPEGVRAALPELMSLTPGVTALVICFLMDDGSASSLDGPLRADYVTFNDPDPRFRRRYALPHILWGAGIYLGHAINTPDVQRRNAVRATFDGLEEACRAWIGARFPGAFTAQGKVELPCSALLVTNKNRPLVEDTSRAAAFDALGLFRHFDAWESDEWPGCRMILPSGWRDEADHMLFACRRHDAFPERPGYAEPESNWTIAQRAHDLIPGLLSRWACSRLLDAHHEQVAIARDEAAGSDSYRTVRDLKRARDLVRSRAYDMQTAAAELAEFAKQDHWYRYNVLEMQYVREVGGQRPDLLGEMQQSQVARSTQVSTGIELLVSTVSSVADFTQTISNIRIQRFIILLTVASVVVATVALVVATGRS